MPNSGIADLHSYVSQNNNRTEIKPIILPNESISEEKEDLLEQNHVKYFLK